MKKLIFLLLPLVLTTACSKAILKDNHIGYPPPSEVEALYNDPTLANFSFKSFRDPMCGILGEPCVDNYSMSGFVKDYLGATAIDAGVLSIAGLSFAPHDDGNGGVWYRYIDKNTNTSLSMPTVYPLADLSFMSHVFGGKEVPISLTKDSKQIFQSTFIVPEEIHWEAPIPTTDGNFYFTRELDFNVKWNKDQSNALGVLIRISCDGKVVMWHSDDDGIENLKEAFAEFPANARYFNVILIRGNIAILDGTDGRRYKIYFETRSQIDLVDR